MENKRIGILGIASIVVAIAMAYVALADTECTSQDCSVSTSLTVGNSNPTITDVEIGITVTLTAESSKTVNVLFNVTDANGFADLNDSTAQCIGYKTGELNRTSTSCTAQDQSGNDLRYNCTTSFQYFDAAAADWKWDCSVSDNSNVRDSNDTITFTINSLNFIDQDLTAFTWSNVNPNVNDQEANAPINLDNGGNQDYESANVTAYNATDGGGNTIPATAFALNLTTGSPEGTQMADNSSVSISSWFTLPHGANSSEDLYAYVDMPSVPNGSYAGTNNWLIDIFA